MLHRAAVHGLFGLDGCRHRHGADPRRHNAGKLPTTVFSKTISEFWKRWHITLGTWFKDYVFYPVVTLKPLEKLTSAARKRLGNHYGPLLASAVALFCVWFCNGLWHGAAWSYLFSACTTSC